MSRMKQASPVATLIGDLVGSRRAADRVGLHLTLDGVIARVNEELAPTVPLRVTVGDEYQGCFATVGEALHAALWLRLALLPDADARHGIGWGAATVLDPEPRIEDGPAWWVARDAIEWVKAEAGRSALRHLRTAYRLAEDTTGPDPAAVNAALICRDQLLGDPAPRSVRLLRGALAGRSMKALAEEEGVSPSAVSQRFRNDGLAAVLEAEELLRGVT